MFHIIAAYFGRASSAQPAAATCAAHTSRPAESPEPAAALKKAQVR